MEKRYYYNEIFIENVIQYQITISFKISSLLTFKVKTCIIFLLHKHPSFSNKPTMTCYVISIYN